MTVGAIGVIAVVVTFLALGAVTVWSWLDVSITRAQFVGDK